MEVRGSDKGQSKPEGAGSSQRVSHWGLYDTPEMGGRM